MPRDDWRFEIEIHPPEWRCPAGSFWIAGWIRSRSGRTPADVRAWLGPRAFLGLCGMPRPELAAASADIPTQPATRPLAGAVEEYATTPWDPGFCLLLEADPRDRLFRLEVCAPDGAWEELVRHTVTADPAAPERPAPALPTRAALAEILLRTLHARLIRPRVSWRQRAEDAWAADDAFRLETLPNPPFYGALERPEQGPTAHVRHHRIAVTGWLAHEKHAIVRLVAVLDPAKPVALLHGLPRPDVSGSFAGLRDATRSKFAGFVEVPDGLPHPLNLRVFAELDDGRRELVFNHRFVPQVVSGAEPQMPPLSVLTFGRAAWAMHRAARRLGRSLESASLWPKALKAAWDGYRVDGPAPLAAPTRPVEFDPTRSAPLHVTLVTHNLNLEGAPLIAFEYGRHLAARPGWRVRVVSPQDGPLRGAFEAAGLAVDLVDVQDALGAKTAAAFEEALDTLGRSGPWKQTDLIVANTMVSFWAVHLAHRLRKPSILYVHESTRVRHFFIPLLDPALFPCVEAAFGRATRVVFSAAAAQRIHAALERRANFRVLPGWIDVTGIAAYAASHDRDTLRQLHEVPGDAVVFANIGSVSQRKGQHVFVDAIDRLHRLRAAQAAPTPRLVFLMVGASPGPYVDLLRHDLALRGLQDVHLIAQVKEPYAYYRLADLFVCSSFEEAFPRVVMEAAVFGLPIVSTDVNGIPEMLTPGDAWLVPPDDAAALASAMNHALEAHLNHDRTRAERARHAISSRYDAATLLPRHADHAAAVAALSAA